MKVFFFGVLTRCDGGIFSRYRRREAMASNATAAKTATSIRKQCEDRRGALIGSTLPQLLRARKALPQRRASRRMQG